MKLLKRKIDIKLAEWKKDPDRLPLIVKGARQIGKTESVRQFGRNNYKSVIEINFILQKQYKSIFEDGFEVDTIIRNISLINPEFEFIPHETLLFFDEFQGCPNCATSLKSFKQDGRFDVICSGSLMGINYNEIESNSVGYKEDYEMYSMDFEEFLWAKSYTPSQIEDMFESMVNIRPLSDVLMKVMIENFREYMVLGGMPAIVDKFVKNKNYSGTLKLQRQILLDYEEDITKYAGGLDKGKILNIYRKIPVFLGKENKKFQISKVESNARNREYVGTVDWLCSAGIVNVCYCMESPELPLKGNCNPDNFKIYFGDTGLLIGSLDEEAQEDLRYNKNFNTYKGAIYENVIAETLVKQGYPLYFYRNEKSTIQMDFFVRDARSLIPVEVKVSDRATASLNNLITREKYSDIMYGIKFCGNNIGWNGKFYTFPYFLAFLLKRFLREKPGTENI
ncbi:MAG: ATP-binding protein [Oscillospiraceae bacterium]|nr:ATP-binding protein [Oscillospiraceae bacterium]